MVDFGVCIVFQCIMVTRNVAFRCKAQSQHFENEPQMALFLNSMLVFFWQQGKQFELVTGLINMQAEFFEGTSRTSNE